MALTLLRSQWRMYSLVCLTGLVDLLLLYFILFTKDLRAAFEDLGIDGVPKASNMNVYIFLGKNPGKKVYITKHYWSDVMAYLKSKHVDVLYLEEKKDVFTTKGTPFWVMPWSKAPDALGKVVPAIIGAGLDEAAG